MSQATVLVIDDTQQVREAFKALLESDGYEFHEADNGEDGIKLAKSVLPDLIILDVMMPGIDGFETCKRIRKDPQIGQIPILMVTALDDKESTVKGLASGADDFINKPVDRLIFLSRIKTITSLNRYKNLREKEETLEKTLTGVVSLLGDLMTLTPNIDTDESTKLEKTVKYLTEKLKIKLKEELLHAARLMGIGSLLVPVDIYRKKAAGNPLAPSEREILEDIPNISIKLLGKVPGFDLVRAIITQSHLTYLQLSKEKYGLNSSSFLGHLIYCSRAFNKLIAEGHSPKSAEVEMNKSDGLYHPKIVSILTFYKPITYVDVVKEVSVGDLKEGMLCKEDIKSKNGTSILKKGEVMNQANIERIMVFHRGIGVEEPLYVLLQDTKV